jgi:single-strand DNA-binding protein
MSGSVNKILLIGNVGQHPEFRTLRNGGRMVTINLATSKSWRNKQSGERYEQTQWHRVVVYDAAAVDDVEKQGVKKGTKLLVEGEMAYRKYQDQQDQTRYIAEVLVNNGFMHRVASIDEMHVNVDGGARRDGPPPPDNSEEYGTTSTRSSSGGSRSRNPDDDEIPF